MANALLMRTSGDSDGITLKDCMICVSSFKKQSGYTDFTFQIADDTYVNPLDYSYVLFFATAYGQGSSINTLQATNAMSLLKCDKTNQTITEVIDLTTLEILSSECNVYTKSFTNVVKNTSFEYISSDTTPAIRLTSVTYQYAFPNVIGILIP